VADVFPLLEPIANRRKLNEMAKLNTHVRQLVTKYFRKRTKSWFPSRMVATGGKNIENSHEK
jgi:hypothetical protein